MAVVTDSTAALPTGAAQRWGLAVVPLDVVIDGERHVEGVDLTPEELVEALHAGAKVTTSQPAPAAFAEVYERLAAEGATGVVSVHLSGELSGTVASARSAAERAPLPVHVVDSRTTSMALGFAALEAAWSAAGVPAEDRLVAGLPEHATAWRRVVGRHRTPLPGADEVAATARARADEARVWFLVESLEYLRRGGRLSAPVAALGTVLGLRPLLSLADGRVVVAEKIRTRRAARERLEAVAAEAMVGRSAVRLAVHHLGQADLAAEVAARLVEVGGAHVREAVVADAGAVLGAHAGPGMLAVVVSGS